MTMMGGWRKGKISAIDLQWLQGLALRLEKVRFLLPQASDKLGYYLDSLLSQLPER